jgi:hypothetical protein
MKRQEFYSIAYIALFGGLWGVTEVLLGNLLHVFDVPFKGTVLSAIGCFICLTGSLQLPSKNHFPILSIGVIAILVRLFSFGVFKIHIFASMFTEVLFIQGAVMLFGYNLLGFIVAGVFACLAPYISGLLLFGIVFGQGSAFLVHGLAKESATLSSAIHLGKIVVAVLFVITALFGSCVGVIAHYFGMKLKRESYA